MQQNVVAPAGAAKEDHAATPVWAWVLGAIITLGMWTVADLTQFLRLP